MAQSTVECTRDELKKDVKLSWTDKTKAEIAAAKGTTAGSGSSSSGSGSSTGGGTQSGGSETPSGDDNPGADNTGD